MIAHSFRRDADRASGGAALKGGAMERRMPGMDELALSVRATVLIPFLGHG